MSPPPHAFAARLPGLSTRDPELTELLSGLRASPPRVSPRWFYDALGSALFDAITRLDEYYPTRCELEILDAHAARLGARLPSGLAVVELGSGSAEKIGRLLPRLRAARAYHPVDVSRAALDATAQAVRGVAPALRVDGLLGDFTDAAAMRALLEQVGRAGPLLLFFPGSTIGNFDADHAARLLAGLADAVPEGTPLLLGVDLVKEQHLLEAAYDDAVGVTAAFNRNLLRHLNVRFSSDFEPGRWRHEARWVTEKRRVEMWLVSEGRQVVRLGDDELVFDDGEGIHTESSHKWCAQSVTELVGAAGWRVEEWLTDRRGWFAETLLVRGPSSVRRLSAVRT